MEPEPPCVSAWEPRPTICSVRAGSAPAGRAVGCADAQGAYPTVSLPGWSGRSPQRERAARGKRRWHDGSARRAEGKTMITRGVASPGAENGVPSANRSSCSRTAEDDSHNQTCWSRSLASKRRAGSPSFRREPAFTKHGDRRSPLWQAETPDRDRARVSADHLPTIRSRYARGSPSIASERA